MEKIELNQKIIDLAKEGWDSEHKPILLSRLGSKGGGEIAEAVRQYASSLSEYIRNELQDKVLLIHHSANSVITGVVPRTQETETISDYDDLLEQCFSRPGQRNKPIRLPQFVWLAFRKPLDANKVRYLSMDEELTFKDIAKDEPIPKQGIEIDSKFIANDAGYIADANIYGNIENWAEDKGIPLEQFSYGSVMRKYKHYGKAGGISLLDHLLNALEPDDLRRINLPMDVVRKLAKTTL